MSGIVGIVNFCGTPVSERLLNELTNTLVFRGPDNKSVWRNGCAGLGHTLLVTTPESKNERQPLSFDGDVWLVSDARIDGRPELIAKLSSVGRSPPNLPVTDADLILHAYHTWGELCVEHLIGDFCFAIWDSRKHSLFCARDHYGVKPFYYAEIENTLVFSNTFECIISHPEISRDFNDSVLADFLLFGSAQNWGETGVKQIKKIPPAHSVVWADVKSRPKKYWNLRPAEDIRYRDSSEYVEHFNHLFGEAIKDRLRANQVALSMSGGLDSTSIAARAKFIAESEDKNIKLFAHTAVYDSIFLDEERYYSEVVAKGLNLPHRVSVEDGNKLFGPASSWFPIHAEPVDNVYWAASLRYMAGMAGDARVALNGQAGDEILKGECLLNLPGKLAARDLFNDLWLSVGQFKKRPCFGVRQKLLDKIGWKKKVSSPEFPDWINQDLCRELDLHGRWDEYWQIDQKTNNAVRAVAYQRMQPDYNWWPYFEGFDSGNTGVLLEMRWPFIDVRLTADLLAFPPLACFKDKQILRESVRGMLPEIVRLRPKQPLAGDPLMAQLKTQNVDFWDFSSRDASALGRFVDVDQLGKFNANTADSTMTRLSLRPTMLYNWVQAQSS